MEHPVPQDWIFESQCSWILFFQGAWIIFPSCFAALACEPNCPRRTLLTSFLSERQFHGRLWSSYTWLRSIPMKLSPHLLFMLSKAPMVKAASKLYEWSWVLISMLAAQRGIPGALGPVANLVWRWKHSLLITQLCAAQSVGTAASYTAANQAGSLAPRERERWMIIK